MRDLCCIVRHYLVFDMCCNASSTTFNFSSFARVWQILFALCVNTQSLTCVAMRVLSPTNHRVGHVLTILSEVLIVIWACFLNSEMLFKAIDRLKRWVEQCDLVLVH